MDLKKLNEPVDAKNIDFRVQSINNGGYATILAYKDARYDMKVLDDVVGAGNWQKDYKVIDGNLYCGIGIYCEDQWIWKWDVGTESTTEKEKGKASDAQKRAGFAWGIGRELYDFPFISVKLNANEFKAAAGGGSPRQTYELKLKEWTWDIKRGEKGEFLSLIAKDEKGIVRFNSNPSAATTKPPAASPQPASKPSSPPEAKPTPPPAAKAVKADEKGKLTTATLDSLRGLLPTMKAGAKMEFIKKVNAIKESGTDMEGIVLLREYSIGDKA